MGIKDIEKVAFAIRMGNSFSVLFSKENLLEGVGLLCKKGLHVLHCVPCHSNL